MTFFTLLETQLCHWKDFYNHKNIKNVFKLYGLLLCYYFQHNDMMAAQDAKRHEEFKTYEMEKEHERREKLHNMTAEERAKEEALYREHRNKQNKHEKIHEPVLNSFFNIKLN